MIKWQNSHFIIANNKSTNNADFNFYIALNA